GHTGCALSVAFSPDGTTLASTGPDRTLRLWDTRTHKQLALLRVPGANDRYGNSTTNAVAFSPDGKTLAVAVADADGGGAVRLLDAHSHRQLDVLHGHKSGVWRLSFSPDGQLLASLDNDGTTLWDAHTHRQLAVLKSCWGCQTSIAFSP